MSWKCVCKEENNPDDSKWCKNCGRTKPKYLGVKLDLGKNNQMNSGQLAVWYLMIAYSFLIESDEYLKIDKEYGEKIGDKAYDQGIVRERIGNCRKNVEKYCDQCMKVLEKTINLNPDAQFKDPNEFIISTYSIKSDCYFNLGSLKFRNGDFDEAISYYQKSYEADANQVSIYNIAMATINLPVEGGSIFGGAKRQLAKETKREEEIKLLKKTIKFAPYSELGIECGRTLIEKYNLTEFDI